MASHELEGIPQDFNRITNDHRSELRFGVLNIDASQIRRYHHQTRCNANSTHWDLEVKFERYEGKYIITYLLLAREDNLTCPVCAKIKVSVTSNTGQSTETENVIRVFWNDTNSYITMQIPHEMVSSPDIQLDVKITLTISGCCTEMLYF